jgi:Rad3-related DNA helicase
MKKKKTWACGEKPTNVVELISKSSQEFVIKNMIPRYHQLFVVFCVAYAKRNRKLLFQVGTGEGKSLIVQLLCTLECHQNSKKV